MRKIAACLILVAMLLTAASGQSRSNPLVGRWDFTIAPGAVWLSVTAKSGVYEVWFQPRGGHVIQIKDAKVDDHSHLYFKLKDVQYTFDAAGDKISGIEKGQDAVGGFTGVRAPELKRSAPKAWTTPEPLFNGKNLDGWQPMGRSHWVVKDGFLINEDKGANLKTTRKFEDFQLHFEANCPDEANSGVYLRGRYELQLEYQTSAKNPPERQMGSIYGRIAPKVMLPPRPGEWDIFDVTLVGRTVTVVRNGVKTIDRKEIEGITGGALDANEGEPGPFYIQGDHTGGLKFRNITVSVPKS